MLISRDNPFYKEIKKQNARFVDLERFFVRYKELFVKRFVQEVKKSGRFPATRIQVVLPLIVKIYRIVSDFSVPAPEAIYKLLAKLENSGIDPMYVLLKVFSSLMMRYMQDHQDDPKMPGNLALLGGYFDAVLHEIHERSVREKLSRGVMDVPLTEVEIETLFVEGEQVGLYNIYKGIPVIYRGEIDITKEGGLRFVVPKEKGPAAEWEGRILFYREEDDHKAILLDVKRVGYDFDHAYIDVENPRWVENYIGRRRSVRIQLDRIIKARIRALQRQLELDVVDLSSTGVCLEGSSLTGLPTSEIVEVELPLPQPDGTVRNLTMRGELRYISKHDLSRRRYHIMLYEDARKEQILSNYIRREEMRLLRELKEKAAAK